MSLVIAASACGTALSANLVSNGRPGATIVLGADAIPAERTAASELQKYIRQMTGTTLPIVSSAAARSNRCRVFIGQTAATKAVLPEFRWRSLVRDGVLIRRVGSDLVIAGDRPRGTLYAVYGYLESLGVRFLAPDQTTVPTKRTIAFPRSDQHYVPKVYYRELTYQRVLHKNPEFCAQMHLNGSFNSTPVEYGGSYNLLGWCHTFDHFLPASEYFRAHPEWYSEVDGKRVGGQRMGQLCLTNEGMKKEFIRRVLEEIRHNPEAGLVDVSQNDGGNGPCTCPRCTAAVKKLGNQTDLLVSFVNDVAAAVEEKYPEFQVETLAYSYTRTPPTTVRPRRNVLIRLCTNCDFSKPLTAPENKPCMDDIVTWSKLVDRLFIWDYVVDFANLHLPYPNMQVLAPNVRTFVSHKAVGIHEQGDLYNTEVSMQPLKVYVLSELMWDPSLDQDKLTREFLRGYYGPAGGYLYSYLRLIERSINAGTHKLDWNGITCDYLTADDLAKAFDLFAKAEAAVADSPVLLKRVRLQKLSVQQAWVRSTLKTREAARHKTGVNDASLADDYQRQAESTGNVFLSEGVHISWDGFRFAAIGETAPSTGPVPERVKRLPATDWKELRLSRAVLTVPSAAKFIDDPQAASGKAVCLDGSSYEWAVQLSLSPFDLKDFTHADVIVSVKCIGRGSDPGGKAFEAGVYDIPNRKTFSSVYKLGDIPDEGYHEYCVGTLDVRDGMFIYLAPPGDSTMIGAMYVDRIYLVKAEAKE